MEPVALNRDVIALAMIRAGSVIRDPRVRDLDFAEMFVSAGRIEAHVANISEALDVILGGVRTVVEDPRVSSVDWGGHIANASATLTWATDANLGSKIETGLGEIDDLLLRLVHAASAMAAFSGGDGGT
jgi:hypothetical protein